MFFKANVKICLFGNIDQSQIVNILKVKLPFSSWLYEGSYSQTVQYPACHNGDRQAKILCLQMCSVLTQCTFYFLVVLMAYTAARVLKTLPTAVSIDCIV